jgi:hypothetical protein
MSNVRLNAGPVCAVYNAPGDETIYYSVELSSQGLKTFHYEYGPYIPVYRSKVSDNQTIPPGDSWDELGVPDLYDGTIIYEMGAIVLYNTDIYYCKANEEE